MLCLVTQLCPTLCDPMDCSPSGSSVQGFLQARILEWVAHPPPRDLPNPGIKSRFPTLQMDSLPSEPPGKPKNTRVGSLSLLQGKFLTQKSNQGLLHCRHILYQLTRKAHSWFIISCKFRVYSTWFSHTYTYISSFLDYSPLKVITWVLVGYVFHIR